MSPNRPHPEHSVVCRPTAPHALAVAALVFAVAGGCAGCLSDLRPAQLQTSGVTEDAQRRGREILARAAQSHGGIDAWRQHRTARFTVEDTWPSAIMRAVAMPWSASAERMRITGLLGRDALRLEFLEGDHRGEQWGIQNWVTYKVDPGGAVYPYEDGDIWFWLPTIEYFFELPFRVGDATIVAHAGERQVGAQTYDLVFVSWGQPEPQSDIDQYVVWVDRDTGLVSHVQYTIRDMAGFMVGNIAYSDVREVQGIKVAHRMIIGPEPEAGGDVIHAMTLTDLTFGVEVRDDFFYPMPERRAAKH